MWNNLWMTLFGTTDLFGINIGFWVGMGLCALVVIIMHIVYWGIMKPKQNIERTDTDPQDVSDKSLAG